MGHIGVGSICDFVAIGLFCDAVLAVVVSCFVVLWVFFFFFFFLAVDWWWWWLWLWLMVVVMVGAVDVFLGSGIYYFIIVFISFYCDIYIILLC